MKQYYSLGELLIDYRNLNEVSQSELAAMLDVDVRSVIRWEKNETLVKSEKEKDLVEQTFIPYQVIRNLNAAVPIPVYFDFKIRKYSISEISIGLPDTAIFKAHLDAVSPMTRCVTENPEQNIKNILHYHRYLYKTDVPVTGQLILEAAKILPELNLVLYDQAGYYAGHCVVLPIKRHAYEKLRGRKMPEGELRATDLANFKTEEQPIFYGYSIYGDCNENMHYMLNPLLVFLKKHSKHTIASLVARPDGEKLLEDLGMKVLWTDTSNRSINEFLPVFMEGKLEGQLD